MPLDPTRLGEAMKAAVSGISEPNTLAGREAMFLALATAIITEITENAVVVVPLVTGVTAGSANSGPGSGSII